MMPDTESTPDIMTDEKTAKSVTRKVTASGQSPSDNPPSRPSQQTRNVSRLPQRVTRARESTASADPIEQLDQYFQLFQGAAYRGAVSVGQISDRVHPDVTFKDPFQQIHGQAALCRLLNHFHHNVQQARFSVESVSLSEPFSGLSGIESAATEPPEQPDYQRWLVKWRFEGELKLIGHWRFSGVSEIDMTPDQRVIRHTDYWDAGEHFYEKLPLLGRLLTWIRHKVARDSQR